MNIKFAASYRIDDKVAQHCGENYKNRLDQAAAKNINQLNQYKSLNINYTVKREFKLFGIFPLTGILEDFARHYTILPGITKKDKIKADIALKSGITTKETTQSILRTIFSKSPEAFVNRVTGYAKKLAKLHQAE